jgi:hypothetical protein
MNFQLFKQIGHGFIAKLQHVIFAINNHLEQEDATI